MEHVAGGDWLSWFKSVSLSLLHHAGRRVPLTFLLGEEKAALVQARFERTIRHAQVEVCTALEVVKEASSGRHVEQGAIPGGRLDTAGQRQGHQPRAEGWVVFKKATVNISVVYGVTPPTRTVRETQCHGGRQRFKAAGGQQRRGSRTGEGTPIPAVA
ncbi:Os07g0435000 [Oryza sativa Japonica Group]|uniref:Os07g0435000 protein n=1 Tax=Oryza sativa subsp. japonica TaxID=39947 RepID=A0A0P0X5J0_ORYSJ|nr:Os07g0435000 [Oryza sativa Japonica Group]